MANLKPYMTEITLSVLSLMFLWFIQTNSSSSLGSAYLAAMFISLILLLINVLIFDKRVDVTFQKEKGGWFNVIFQGVIGWVLILISSYIVFTFVFPEKSMTFNSIISSLGAANPAFANSKILNWLVVSFAIGYGETQLFARIFEFLTDRFKIQVNRKNMFRLSLVIIIIALSVLFAIYHLTAKGIGNTASILVVAIMMIISLFFIVWNNGETRAAVMIHIISNGVAGASVLFAGGTLFG